MATMVVILKIYFGAYFPKPKSQMTRQLIGIIGALVNQNSLNHSDWKIQDCRPSSHVETYFDFFFLQNQNANRFATSLAVSR